VNRTPGSTVAESNGSSVRPVVTSRLSRHRTDTVAKSMNEAIFDRYPCPERFIRTSLTDYHSADDYLRFGRDLLDHGGTCSAIIATANNPNPSLLDKARTDQPEVQLPFDLTQLIDNLRHERYSMNSDTTSSGSAPNHLLSELYYSLRPFLPRSLRILLSYPKSPQPDRFSVCC